MNGNLKLIGGLMIGVALATSASVLAGAPGGAEADRPNSGKKPAGTGEASPDSAEVLSTAEFLADWGREHGNGDALVAAARLLQSVDVTELKATRTAGQGAPGAKAAERAPITANGLLDEASAMDPKLAAYVKQRREFTGSRGNTLGPQSSVSRVMANSEDMWDLGAFRGGEFAAVEVRGDGDTDLDCWIYDEHGNLIDRDTDRTDYCVLSWTPAYTGGFTLKIANLGNVYNQYRVSTN
jgi:hypothetical protein